MEFAVLIIDDEELLLKVSARRCQHAFKEAGHEVTVVTATNGQDAVTALQNRSFSHILCDMEFPLGDAPTVYARAVATNPEVTFVANTGNWEHRHVSELARMGVRTLFKPYGMQELLEALRIP